MARPTRPTTVVQAIGDPPRESEAAGPGPAYRPRSRATKWAMNPADRASDAPAPVPTTPQVTAATLDTATVGAEGHALAGNEMDWPYSTPATNQRSPTRLQRSLLANLRGCPLVALQSL